MLMQRQAVNNSTFGNEQDIGRVITDWTRNYNKKHGRVIINKIFYKKLLLICLHNFQLNTAHSIGITNLNESIFCISIYIRFFIAKT